MKRTTSCSLGRIATLASVAAAVSLASGCATNPVTQKRELMLVSQAQEIEMGREAARQVEAVFGLVEDPQLASYVADLGRRLAQASERPSLPWSFKIVDDTAVNAFALPGGPIYVTRGLLAYLNSEAELVAVLGHEIGHVTARHSARRMSEAQLATIGLGVGMILEPAIARYGEAAQAGLSLLFLKFGRDDERQADALGLRYMTAQAYDPQAMREVLRTLDRVGQREAASSLPGWLSTHPTPEDRIERLAAAPAGDGREGRDAYLKRLDGLTFGDDPRQGFFENGVFYHPELRFRLDFPRGWKTANARFAVTGQSPEGDAALELTLSAARSAGSAAEEFARAGGLATSRPRGGPDDVSLDFEAQGRELGGRARFVAHGGRVYRLLGYGTERGVRAHLDDIDDSLRSFRALAGRAPSVEPSRVDVVTLDRAMTVEEFARHHPSSLAATDLALLNGLEAGERLPAGGLLKRVVGGERRSASADARHSSR